jgi:hypothetical protein
MFSLLSEDLIVPVTYILTNLFIILTNDVNELVVGSFRFILVAGEVTVELAIIISQYGRMGCIGVEGAVLTILTSICTIFIPYALRVVLASVLSVFVPDRFGVISACIKFA